MFYAVWLGIHVIGVLISGYLLYRVASESVEEYKSGLQLMVACSVVVLVAHTMYILSSGSVKELITIEKMEYLGKCFATYYCIMFILRYRGVKWPKFLTDVMFLINLAAYIFVFTCERHSLYYTTYHVEKRASGYELIVGHGPVHTVYMMVQIVEMVIYAYYCAEPIIKRRLKYMSRKNRAVQISLAMSGIVPLLLIVLTATSITHGLDTVPLGVLMANLFMFIAIYGQGMFDVVRLAKDAVVESVNEGIIITDAQYNLLYANEASRQLFPNVRFAAGTTSDESIVQIMQSQNEIMDIEDKKYKIHINELKKGDSMNAYAATIVDVTDELSQADRMRELKEKAEKANEAKSFFLSNMSHEIRTPMNAIVGMTEIMLREELDDTIKGYLQNIQSSGRSLIGIINDVLDFSKMESGKMELVATDYEPVGRIDELGMMFLTRIGEKDIKLLFDIDPDMPSVLNGDVLRLRQVLINLVNNAIKFTEEGFVRLTMRIVSKEKDMLTLYAAVEDSGQGISQDGLKKLFNSFEQVDSKRNYEKEGTGLGLAISKQLVELMDGSLQVESTYGVGSKFYCTIKQQIVDEMPSVKLKIDESEQKSIVISAYLDNEHETKILEELCEHYELEYIPYAEMVRQRRKITHFFIDQAQYREVGSEISELIGEEAELIVLYNPMSDVIEDQDVTLMARPLFSLSFCSVISHEKRLASSDAQTYISFVAPNAHILIVDDNAMNLKVAVGLLEPLKMQIDVAESGKQAIEMLKSMDYDLVFMDHMMPVMDGIETTQYIRGLDDPYYAELPIIALSANALTGARDMFLENGMNDFVAKPIEIHEICEKIRTWLPDDYIEASNVVIVSNEAEEVDLSEFASIKGINPKEGVKYSGSKELFASLLTDFYKLIDMKANKIEKCLADGMLKDYTIEVHALKNTARMIGAMELSEDFKRMEMLGNEQAQERLDQESPAVLAKFRAYKEYLKVYAAGDENEKEETDSTHLCELLERIINGMNEFDLDGVDAAMNELDGYKMPDSCKDKMDELRAYVADVAMEEVMNLAQEMIGLIQG